MINWKLRLKNRATLVSLIAIVITMVYQICGLFGVVPPISQDEAINGFGILLNLLVAVGVIVDPTTEGIHDSYQAMEYDKPREE